MWIYWNPTAHTTQHSTSACYSFHILSYFHYIWSITKTKNQPDIDIVCILHFTTSTSLWIWLTSLLPPTPCRIHYKIALAMAMCTRQQHSYRAEQVWSHHQYHRRVKNNKASFFVHANAIKLCGSKVHVWNMVCFVFIWTYYIRKLIKCDVSCEHAYLYIS